MEKQEQKNKMFNELVKVVKALEAQLFITLVSVFVMVLGHLAVAICVELLGFDPMWTRTTVVCIWRVCHTVVAFLVNKWTFPPITNTGEKE